MSATNIHLKKKFEEVPWTLQQIFLGILFTLVFGLVTVVALAGLKSSPARPLPPDRDLANAIVFFICGLILEAVFLIAPLFYARWAVREASGKLLELPFRRAGQISAPNVRISRFRLAQGCVLDTHVLHRDLSRQFPVSSSHPGVSPFCEDHRAERSRPRDKPTPHRLWHLDCQRASCACV